MKKSVILFCLFYSVDVCINAQMSGSYSVCSDEACDFHSISEAIDSLVSRTMGGPVTLILSDSIFNEQDTIPFIEGASGNNTLTIIPSDDLPGEWPVHIVYSSSSVNDNFVLAFDSAMYVNIQNIDIHGMDPNYATCLLFENGSKNININSCSLNSQATSTSNVFFVNDLASDSISIVNSTIRYGGNGILLFGSTGNNVKNTVITGNNFINNSLAGISVSKGENLSVLSNVFRNNDPSPAYKGLDFNNVYGYIVDRNYMYLINGTGMNLAYSGVDSSWATNNIIYISGTGGTNDVGIAIANGNTQFICFNTVVIDSMSSNLSSALQFPSSPGSGSMNYILNNNLANFAAGYAISVPDTDPLLISECDYNNLYGDQTSLTNYQGTDYDSLANWQTTTGFDGNSLSVNPMFADTTCIIYCAPELENAGLPYGVDYDFANYMRDTLTPDIGAVEKNISDWSLPEHSASICNDESYTIDAGSVNYGSYNWSNGSTDQVIELTEDGWYYLTVTDGCTEAFDSLHLEVRNCNPVNIPDNNTNYGISLIPNPVKDDLVVRFENPLIASIEIVTLEGKQLTYINIPAQSAVNIDVSHLNKGVYFIRIKTDQYTFTRKFVKQ